MSERALYVPACGDRTPHLSHNGFATSSDQPWCWGIDQHGKPTWEPDGMPDDMPVGPGGVSRKETVDHPAHYGGGDDPYEVIKVLEAWGLTEDAYLFNVVKYIARAGKKGDYLEDLKKAAWYLNRKIQRLETPPF